MLTLTASFDLDWPDTLTSFFTSTKPISELTTQFISIDCFIDTRKSNADQGLIRVFFSKVLVYSVTPFIVILFSYLIWHIIFCLKKKQRIQLEVNQTDLSIKDKSKQLNSSADELAEVINTDYKHDFLNNTSQIIDRTFNNDDLSEENKRQSDIQSSTIEDN